MTYGIFDKEELRFEKQLDALLTEAPPKRKPGHWSDIYARAGWDDTPNTPVTPEKPKDKDTTDNTPSAPVVPTDNNNDGTEYDGPMPLGLRVKPSFHPPSGQANKLKRLAPPVSRKQAKPKVNVKKPVVKNITQEPVKKQPIKKVTYDPLANRQTVPKKIVKPASRLLPPDNIVKTPNKQLQLAQNQADNIVKKLSQAKGQERLRLTTQLKQIASKNPTLKYDKQLLLPEPESKVVPKGKVTDLVPDTALSTSSNPELDNAKKLLKTLKPGTKRYKLIQQQVQALSGNAVDPTAADNRAKAQAASNAIQKAEQEALQKRQEKQKLQQQAAAAAEEKRKAKELEQAKAKAEAEAKLKAKKATPVVEPQAQSNIGKGTIQPEKGQGIKSFAKQLGYDNVDEFEKANPKGVGVASNGNKFVKTGVNYIPKDNELANAQAILKKLDPNSDRAKKLRARINPDEIIGKPDGPKAPVKKLDDLRPKWGVHRKADEAKMLLQRGKNFGGKVAKQLGTKAGYLVPGLNAALIAYDIHELMIGKANAGEDAYLRQVDLTTANGIISSNATAEEKKKSIKGLLSTAGTGSYIWDTDTETNDPPMDINIDIWNMSAEDIKSKIPEIMAGTPHTQKDMSKLFRRLQQKRNYDRQVAKSRPASPQDYNKVYEEKMRALTDVQNTLPKTRAEAHVNYLMAVIDANELPEGTEDNRPSMQDAIAAAQKSSQEQEANQQPEEKSWWEKGYDAVAGMFDDDEADDTAGVQAKPVVSVDPKVKNLMDTSYKQGTEGFPTSFGEYENLMQELSNKSGVPIQMLRALGKRESGIHVKSNGKLSGWDPVGDKDQGTGASMGIFHVRSSEGGAAVEQYNQDNGTNYDWKNIAKDPKLAATIGAWYFKYWLDRTNGDPIQAYMHYNGGPGGNLKPLARANAEKYAKDLDYFQESKFIKKSAILEGMSKVNI